MSKDLIGSLLFNYIRYFNEEEMVDHVASIQYLGQTTNTPAALRVNSTYIIDLS